LELLIQTLLPTREFFALLNINVVWHKKYAGRQCYGSGSCRIRILSDPDLLQLYRDAWDRIQIRILARINGPKSTFLVCVKARNTFLVHKLLFRVYFRQKISRRNLARIRTRKFPKVSSGSGQKSSGSGTLLAERKKNTKNYTHYYNLHKEGAGYQKEECTSLHIWHIYTSRMMWQTEKSIFHYAITEWLFRQ
jgi:hypothetical protein